MEVWLESNLNPAEVGAALENLSPAEWKKIKIMAGVYAKGLILLSRDDLIQETFAALFSGDRRFPREAKPANVVINAMHSEASNCREREKNGAVDHHVDVATLTQSMDEDGDLSVVPSTEITPERIAENRQLMAAINTLVEDDPELQDLVAVWCLDMKGQDAAEYLEWDMKKYEAARKRLVRRLDKMKES